MRESAACAAARWRTTDGRSHRPPRRERRARARRRAPVVPAAEGPCPLADVAVVTLQRRLRLLHHLGGGWGKGESAAECAWGVCDWQAWEQVTGGRRWPGVSRCGRRSNTGNIRKQQPAMGLARRGAPRALLRACDVSTYACAFLRQAAAKSVMPASASACGAGEGGGGAGLGARCGGCGRGGGGGGSGAATAPQTHRRLRPTGPPASRPPPPSYPWPPPAAPPLHLHREGRVPELAAVVALHLHAVLSHPQVVVHPVEGGGWVGGGLSGEQCAFEVWQGVCRKRGQGAQLPGPLGRPRGWGAPAYATGSRFHCGAGAASWHMVSRTACSGGPGDARSPPPRPPAPAPAPHRGRCFLKGSPCGSSSQQHSMLITLFTGPMST